MILKVFPKELSNIILENIVGKEDKLEEIRIRRNRPIILKFMDEEKIISHNVQEEELIKILQII